MSTATKELQKRIEENAELQAKITNQIQELKDQQLLIDTTWKEIEKAMVENDIKSIKGEWGSITIAERDVFSSKDLESVPRKFIKKALDTAKVKTFYTLEDKLPKGVDHKVTKYLTKRIKQEEK